MHVGTTEMRLVSAQCGRDTLEGGAVAQGNHERPDLEMLMNSAPTEAD